MVIYFLVGQRFLYIVYRSLALEVVVTSDKLACWALISQEYEFKLIHRPRKTHQNVDTISRNTFPSYEYLIEAC